MDKDEKKRIEEAKLFVSNIMNKEADLAKERDAISKLSSKFDKIAQKVKRRTPPSNNINEIRTYTPNNLHEMQSYSPNSINEVQNFNKMVEDAARKMLQEANYNPEMRDALNTTEIQHPTMPNVIGVKKSNFAVYPMPNADGKTRYDVVNLTENKKIVDGLRLNDSADAIVKLLNKGYSFYSPEVNSVLKMEESYTKHYNDMIVYKRKDTANLKEGVKEVRFQEAKAKAIAVKEQLHRFNNSLR